VGSVYERLAESELDWPNWHVWWSDERDVPPDDDRSNEKLARAKLLSRVSVPEEQIHPLRSTEVELPERFDLILLGIGPDAHTCSLFPGDDAVNERDRPVVGVETPGMAPLVSRITLTLSVVNGSRQIVFLITGADKADAVARAFAGPPDVSAPASLVDGEATVLLDEAAAAGL
jgi:6-phosphogluconolactonase